MEEKKIIIEIQEDGKIHAETDGMIGTECTDELDRLMKDLAGCVTRTKKPDYFKEKSTVSSEVGVGTND